MSYTKAPVSDTHNVQRVMAGGTPFLVSDIDNERAPWTLNFINCYPETENQWASEPRKSIQKRGAWLRDGGQTGFSTVGTALSRSGVLSPDQASYPKYFFPKGATFYEFDYSSGLMNAVYTPASGTVWRSYGTSMIDSTNASRVVFLDPVGWIYSFLLDGTGDTITDQTAKNLVASKGLVFLNSYLFAVDTSGYKIYNSAVGGAYTTWNTTDYLSAEQYSDPVMWIDKHKNYLVAFGTNSIEFFYDGGVEVGSPLTRQETYSRQIGLYYDDPLLPGKNTAYIDDDLYFLGVKEQSHIGLFRIRNFQVEEIQCSFFKNVVNFATSAVAPAVRGIESIIVNNNTMILINLYNESYSLVYYPEEDSWWMLQQSTPTLYDFPQYDYRIGKTFYGNFKGLSYFLSADDIDTDTVFVHTPDVEHTESMQCEIRSEVIDFGVNYYKHFARVDAIGDFGNNTITLQFNGSPSYQNSYGTASPTRTVTTLTSGNNQSFYNLGAYRQLSFSLTIAGTSHAIFRGLDIEYNIGAT